MNYFIEKQKIFLQDHQRFPKNTIFKVNTPNNPTTDTIISITDHERKVSFMLRLKYSLNSQNPESFTCENSKLPAPNDKTIKFGLTPV